MFSNTFLLHLFNEYHDRRIRPLQSVDEIALAPFTAVVIEPCDLTELSEVETPASPKHTLVLGFKNTSQPGASSAGSRTATLRIEKSSGDKTCLRDLVRGELAERVLVHRELEWALPRLATLADATLNMHGPADLRLGNPEEVLTDMLVEGSKELRLDTCKLRKLSDVFNVTALSAADDARTEGTDLWRTECSLPPYDTRCVHRGPVASIDHEEVLDAKQDWRPGSDATIDQGVITDVAESLLEPCKAMLKLLEARRTAAAAPLRTHGPLSEPGEPVDAVEGD